MDRIYLDNDLVITLDGLTDEDGTPVTGAQVEARVLDRSKAEVAGVTWPVALSHVGGGTYKGVIDASLVLVPRALYYVEVTASYGEVDATWRIQHLGAEREA